MLSLVAGPFFVVFWLGFAAAGMAMAFWVANPSRHEFRAWFHRVCGVALAAYLTLAVCDVIVMRSVSTLVVHLICLMVMLALRNYSVIDRPGLDRLFLNAHKELGRYGRE